MREYRYIGRDALEGMNGFRICLSSDLAVWYARAIRRYQTGTHQYSHAWILMERGQAVSQNFRLARQPLSDYLNGTTRIKMWRCVNWSDKDLRAMKEFIEGRLALPWYRRRYDFLAYVGQITRIKVINDPLAYICSEFVGSVIQAGYRCGLQRHPSPGDIDEFLGNDPAWDAVCYDPERGGVMGAV